MKFAFVLMFAMAFVFQAQAAAPIDMHGYTGEYHGTKCSMEITPYDQSTDYFLVKFVHPGFLGIGKKTSSADFTWAQTYDPNSNQIILVTGDEDSYRVELDLDANGQITQLAWDEGHYSPVELPHSDHYVCKSIQKTN